MVEWLTKALGEQVPDGSLWLVAELDGEAVGDCARPASRIG